MVRMVRKQLYLDDETDRRLVERAKLLGMSQAKLVRIAVDRYLSGGEASVRATAAAELMAVLREIQEKGPVPGGGGERSWKREDLYDRY